MKRFVLNIPVILILTACGEPSVDDLIEDPELLAEVAQECQLMQMQGKDVDTEECNNAKEAVSKMTKNMMDGMMQDLNNGSAR